MSDYKIGQVVVYKNIHQLFRVAYFENPHVIICSCKDGRDYKVMPDDIRHANEKEKQFNHSMPDIKQ